MRRIAQMGVDSPLRKRGEVRTQRWMWAGREEASRASLNASSYVFYARGPYRRRVMLTLVVVVVVDPSPATAHVVDAGRCVGAVYVLYARLGRIARDAGTGGDCDGRIIIECAGERVSRYWAEGRGGGGGVCGCCGML
jgi:hypothetical protein